MPKLLLNFDAGAKTVVGVEQKRGNFNSFLYVGLFDPNTWN